MTAANDLSSLYLTDEANLVQARFELHRAQEAGDVAMAVWARRWGDPCLIAIDAAHEGRSLNFFFDGDD